MRKTIGILGGMGPDASARLYQMMIDIARDKYNAKGSDDYPELLIHNIPVPDFFDDPKKTDDGVFLLKSRVRQLSKLDLDCIAMACNTAHTTITDLQTETNTPFLVLPELMADAISRDHYNKVGLLATPLTVYSGIYKTALLEKNIEVVNPLDNDLETISKIVHEILGGEFENGKRKLIKIADKLKQQGVEAIVLGCTELPLVFPDNYSLKSYSSIAVLAESLLKRYYKK